MIAVVHGAAVADPVDQPDVVPSASTTVVVHELSMQGPNGEHDEFIEIRNISTVHQDLSDLVVRFYSPACQVAQTVPLTDVVLSPMNSAGEFLVLIGRDFSGSVAPSAQVLPVTGTSAAGLLDARGGGAALFEANRRIDGVAWAPPLSQGCRMEGLPARIPPRAPKVSISRDLLGTDTDNNRCDFHIAVASPGSEY